MSTELGKIIADFTTQLATKLTVGLTTATLQSATDDDGVAIPNGHYFFTLDGSNSRKEHIACTVVGTAVTAIKSVSRQGVETVGVLREHRVGASVTITDFAHIKKINSLLDGTTDLDATTPLKYDGTASITNANHLATKGYVDGVAIAGSPDASTTVKGISRVSVAPVSATIPISVGDNDPRVPTQSENDAMVGNNIDIAVGTGNKNVTQTGLQHNAEKYAVDTSASSTAYVVTLSPAFTSYTDGMVVYAKIVTANTTATPTLAVNGLTARTIVKLAGTALAIGDISANMLCTFVYDLTNTRWVLQNPVANQGASLTAYLNTQFTSPSNTSENTIATLTGHLMGANDQLVVRGVMSIGSAGGVTNTYRIKFGSTTIASWTTNSAVNYNYTLTVSNRNSTSAQVYTLTAIGDTLTAVVNSVGTATFATGSTFSVVITGQSTSSTSSISEFVNTQIIKGI